jgi:hypothetical protein
MAKLKEAVRKAFPFLRPVYSVLRNWRVRLLKWRPTYDREGLITDASCEFMHAKRFVISRDAAIRGGAVVWRQNDWRIYVACWAGEQGKLLEGDFVECGVEKGMLARTIMEYVGFAHLDKKFYLVDTYRGMDERFLTPSERVRESYYPDTFELVKKQFALFPNAIIVRGAVPEVLDRIRVDKVAYLSIDMNSVMPEIAAAEYFWNKMSPGAVMLLDDYGNAGREEQRDAFDEFAKRKSVPILSLPTGQGLIVKP